MALDNLILPGEINQTGTPDDTFLELFHGEVVNAYERARVTEGMTIRKPITTGLSAVGHGRGRSTAGSYARGESIFTDGYLNTANFTEPRVWLDRPMISVGAFDEQDLAQFHTDVQGAEAREQGIALAEDADTLAMRTLLRTARTVAPSDIIPADQTDADGGFIGSIPPSNGRTPEDMHEALINAAVMLDEKSVPREGRTAILSPVDYWLLVLNQDLLNSLYGNTGNGVLSMGTIFYAAGFKLVMSNLIPSTNVVANDAGHRNDYRGDFTDVVGICFRQDAVLEGVGMSIGVESTWSTEYQSQVVLSKRSGGFAPNRPAAVVELSTAGAQPTNP